MMPKKILLTVPRLNIGGAESYVAMVARHLHRLGFEVHIASGGGLLADELQRQGIVHHFVPIRFNAALAAWFLTRIVRKRRIDLIHANSAAAGIAAVKAGRRLGVPVVYTAHGVFSYAGAEKTLEQCDRIICVSEYLRARAAEKGFAPEKLRVIYNGVDMERFRPDPQERRRLRALYGFAEDDFVMALVARIKNLRNKGHEDLLRVLAERPGTEHWRLLVIGKGNALWKLRWRIRRLGLEGKVRCLGHQTDVYRYLNAADAIVLPSKFETFGLVLAEGMAMGKPAAAYAVGGVPEVIRGGETGFLAPVGDFCALGEQLSAWAQDRPLRADMGEKARRYAEKHFSERRMMEQLLALYGEFFP